MYATSEAIGNTRRVRVPVKPVLSTSSCSKTDSHSKSCSEDAACMALANRIVFLRKLWITPGSLRECCVRRTRLRVNNLLHHMAVN